MEGLGFLHGVSGGAVGAGGLVVGDGAASHAAVAGRPPYRSRGTRDPTGGLDTRWPSCAAKMAVAKGPLSHSFCCLSPAKSQYMLYYCRTAKSLNNLNELADEKSEHSERFVRRDIACSAHERLCEGHHRHQAVWQVVSASMRSTSWSTAAMTSYTYSRHCG